MENNNKKFIVSEIECILAPEFVKKRPEMYWDTSEPRTEDAVNAIVEQFNSCGIADIKILESDGWQYVGSSQDWIKPGLDDAKTEKQLFETAYGLPEAGGTSLRVEFFIKIFSENLILWRNNEVLLIKGEYSIVQTDYLNKHFYNLVALAFKGNIYEAIKSNP